MPILTCLDYLERASHPPLHMSLLWYTDTHQAQSQLWASVRTCLLMSATCMRVGGLLQQRLMMNSVCVCVSVQTVCVIGLTAPTVKGAAESTGVCSLRASLMPSRPSSTSSLFLSSSCLPPPSAVILIQTERLTKECRLALAGQLPPVETWNKKADKRRKSVWGGCAFSSTFTQTATSWKRPAA